jgi:trimethylamine:corrinoid methyltransferase-like protein
MAEQIPVETLRPGVRMLSDEQLQTIHYTSLDILARTGIVMKHQAARRTLLDAGAWESGDRIRIPEHVVNGAIGSAPSRILLHNRLGRCSSDLARTARSRWMSKPGRDARRQVRTCVASLFCATGWTS